MAHCVDSHGVHVVVRWEVLGHTLYGGSMVYNGIVDHQYINYAWFNGTSHPPNIKYPHMAPQRNRSHAKPSGLGWYFISVWLYAKIIKNWRFSQWIMEREYFVGFAGYSTGNLMGSDEAITHKFTWIYDPPMQSFNIIVYIYIYTQYVHQYDIWNYFGESWN